MTVALASMVSGRPVDPSVAMTGEVTLTGQVLPVGGIKEKVLAARAAGITRVFLPDRNEADVEEIRGDDLLTGLQFTYVDHVDVALDKILCRTASGARVPKKRPAKTAGAGADPASKASAGAARGTPPSGGRAW